MRGWVITTAVAVLAAPTWPGRVPVASAQPEASPPTTQPAGAPPSTQPSIAAPTTQPAAAPPGPIAYTGSTELSDSARIEVVGDKLVVAGTQSDLALIRTLVEAMEQTGPQMEIKLFSMKNIQAQSVAPTLQRLWTELQQGRVTTPEDRVSILADQLSNTIVIGGTQANIDRLGKLIEGFENAPRFVDEIKNWTPIELKHIRASEAADVVRQTLEKMQKSRGVSGPSPIDVQVDPRQNTLLIVAPQKDIDQVRRLIDIIDQEPKSEFGGVAKLAVFPLVKGSADTIAKTLDDMIKLEGQQQNAVKEQIRRLRLTIKAGADGRMEDLPDLDLEKPIKIVADKGMNAVIIGTTEKNIVPLTQIVNLLDTVPTSEEMLIRVFPLKNADAQNMQEMLTNVFKQGKDLAEVPGKTDVKRVPPGPAGSAMAYNVNIASDPRTNTLIVAGRMEQLALAQKLVEEMDVEGIGVRFPVRILHVEHADPERISDIVTKLNQGRMDALKSRGVKSIEMERVFIVPDARSESIIVSAKEENFKEVEELVRRLDSTPANFLGDIHIITCTNLTASDLGPKIEQLWEKRASLKASKTGEKFTEKPVIITDTRSNALVIASSKEDYVAIEALVKQLEQQPLAPTAEIRLHVLKHSEAGKLGPQLQKLFEERAKNRLAKGQEEQPSDRVTIVTDDMSNTLLIAASRETYDEMVRLLSQLDVPLDVAGVIKLYPLQNADATRAAKLIEDLFQKGIQRGGATAAVPESQKKVSIVTDARSNALIVSASPENFAIVERLLKQIDSSETPGFITPESRIFQIKYADAVKVADMLGKLVDGIKKSLPQVEQDQLNMTFIPEDRSNVVIVTGSRYGMKRAEELIEKIDREPGTPSGEPQVYQLKHATASKLAEMLTELFEKRKPTGGQSSSAKTPVYIVAAEDSNSLIVTAAREDHSIVQQLLGMLDKQSAFAQQMEIIPLQRAKAEDLSDTLTKLLEKQKGTAKGTAYSIAPEARTNSLIVFAGPDMMNNIRIITEKLDQTQPVLELGMRVIRLQQARAEDLSKRLQEFFKEMAGQKAGSKEGSSIINFKQFDAATQKDVLRKLVHQDVTITPDARTNSLLVLAPADSVDMLEQMIQMLDEVTPITATIQMFVLRNADAEETLKLLEELFQVGEKAKKGAGGQGETERQLVVGASGGGVTTGAVELAFSVDKRTNTVIAAGSPEYLDTVEQVIRSLDSLDIQNRVQRIVKLRNAVAEDVATTMEGYFKAEEQAVKTEGTEESVLKKLERQVTVKADKGSNTVLLSYNPRMESQIVDMINKLDQQPPQVMIQVLLAEITLSDNLELGMEFALQDLRFTEGATVGPNNTIQGNGYDLVAGTDIGAAGSGSGFSFTITGEDFNFLFHALQGESRIEVLSRPSIMVADNEKANITVGTRVPVVQNVTVSTGGIVVPSVSYEKVGILLDVEPHINPDGYVNLSVKPTISDIGTSSISVGSGINLPTFLERSAETVVTVRDGETIVIGGLIKGSDTGGETKVPLFGDVPILGNAFRASTRKKEKTELLIVLTPHVIRTEEEAREISIRQRDQSGLLERVRISPLMEKLQVKPEDEGLLPAGELPTTRPAGTGGPQIQLKGPVYGPPLDLYGPETNAVRESSEGPGAAEVATKQDEGANVRVTVGR